MAGVAHLRPLVLSVPLWLCGPAASAPAQDAPHRHQERVNVDRVVVEVRVLDNGKPVRGLRPQAFRLEVDGEPVAIESVRWVGHAPGAAVAPPSSAEAREPAAGADATAPVPPRLILLFFQKDLAHSRGAGLLRIQPHARALVDGLAPDDRVAVVSHDSRLRLWLDFTSDRAAARHAIEHSVLFGRPTPGGPEGPTLRALLDEDEARRAATPEQALLALARPLARMPGSKVVALFGWGMGRLGATGVHMEPEYEQAQAALDEAGATVFTLDLTNADFHSLEVGLQRVSQDTGGTYSRTHLFPGNAVRQVAAALSGHYLLSFVRPALPRGEHRMRIRVDGGGSVLARPGYTDP